MVESSSNDGSDAQSHSDDDAATNSTATNGASAMSPSDNGGRRSQNRRNNDNDTTSATISRSGQATTNHNTGHHQQGNGDGGGRLGGAGSTSARFSSPNNTSKRLIDSPASAAGTGSTCSLSTAASHGLGLGSISGGGGGAAGAMLGGGSMAVGTLTVNEHTPGRGGMHLNSRHGKNQQSRQERRALRRRQRRGNRNQWNQTPTAVLRQLQTMSATLGVSFGLFLLFYLNLPALLFLMTTLAIGALTAMIGYQYLILQYNAVLASGGFIQFLPEGVQESLRDALEGTTLHEWMTDPAFFMEYRYLLLYYIPGLDADQLNALVDRLPERHRRVLRRPGYMSSMTPASVRRVLIADDDGEDDGGLGNNAATLQALPGPSSGENSSIGLNDRTRRQLFEDDGGTDVGDENVDNADAQYEPSTTELWADIAATITSVLQGSAVGQATLGAIQEEDDDGGSNDAGSLVIERLPSDGGSSDDDESVPARQLEDSIPPTVTTMARQAAMPQTPPPSQSAAEEQQIEGEILNDAAAEMSRHYVNAAVSTARDVFADAVEFLAPGVVRLGLGTSIVSGFGLFGSYYINFVRGHPLGWQRPLPRLTGDGPSGGGSSSSDGIAGDQGETISASARFVTYGLLSSAFLGGASAGLMLLLRNGVRRSIAAERAKIEDEGEGKRSKGDKNG